MKYTAKLLTNGKWAVCTGKKFFNNTAVDSEEDAKIKAIEMSAQWHRSQIDALETEWEKLVDPDPTMKKKRDYVWSDIMC